MKQTALDFKQLPSYARDDFIVSRCNELVWQWLTTWPKWPSYGAIIVGPKAAGKTHLLHCWQSMSHAAVVDSQDTQPHYTQPLAIDDADGWISESAQIKLFHLLNQTKETKHTVLLTATTPPGQWRIDLKDLRSRLLSFPIWELNAPDEALLAGILSKHFTDRQISVDSNVIHYIVTRSERSFATIQDIAQRIDAFAWEEQRPITTALVRRWMEMHQS